MKRLLRCNLSSVWFLRLVLCCCNHYSGATMEPTSDGLQNPLLPPEDCEGGA